MVASVCKVESSARDTFLAPCYVGCVQSKKTERETKERLEEEGEGQEWLGRVTPLTHFVFLLVVCEAIHRLAGPGQSQHSSSSTTLHGGGDQATPSHFLPLSIRTRPCSHPHASSSCSPSSRQSTAPTHQQICLGLFSVWHMRPGVGDFTGRWHEAYDSGAAGPQDGRHGTLL